MTASIFSWPSSSHLPVNLQQKLPVNVYSNTCHQQKPEMSSKHTQTAQVSTIGDKSVDDPIVTVNNGTDDTEVVLQCTICSETLEYSSLLDRHIESVHGSSSSESSCPDWIWKLQTILN